MSKQTLLTQGAKWVDLSQLAAAPATPAAGSNRLYVDANGLLQFTSPAGSQASRRITTDWGVGTALPATGLGRGDIYTHSGIGCQFLWNGAQWRQTTRALVTTEAQLAVIATSYAAALHDGVEVFCSDTKATAIWDATNTTWHISDSVDQTFTPTFTTAGGTPAMGNGTLTGRYRRMGRLCWLLVDLTSGSSTNWGTGAITFGLPAALTAATTGTEQWIPCKAWTAGGNFAGLALMAGATVQPWLPASASNAVLNNAASANSGGATGTGTPVVAGSFTFGGTSNMHVEGIFSLVAG